MKKKIEKLRRAGRLEGNAAFETLWDAYQSAAAAFEQIKTDRKIARATLHFERDQAGAGPLEADKRFELEMAVMRAEGQRLICRADYRLARFHLRQWLDAFTRLPVAAEKTPEKAAPKKTKTPAAPKRQPASDARPKPARRKKPAKTEQA